VERNYGRLEVLINNAGVASHERVFPLEVTGEIVRRAFGVINVTHAFIPLPRIVNVNSTMGSHTKHADTTSFMYGRTFVP
jgi:NAD(P)-dependent dehydrogenase (short-subunit alcohol dehydrogenase family)